MSRSTNRGIKKQSRTAPASKGQRDGSSTTARRSTIGAEILEALEEVRDAVKSGEPLEQRFTVRSFRFDLRPRDYGPSVVQSVRQLLGLSQPLFADFLGVDASTVRSWEQGTRLPSPIARRFMDEITANPDYWRGRLRDSLSESGVD